MVSFALVTDAPSEPTAARSDLTAAPKGAPSAPPGASAAPGGGPAFKVRPIPGPPELPLAPPRTLVRFLAVLLAAAVLTTLAVGTLNVLADPYGTLGTSLLPTVTGSDRTVKADAIEALDAPPELVVLGSSRSMRYEPAYLEEKTGLRTFNAGVNGIGGTADAWAMTQLIHDTFPDARPSYFWLLDVESFVPFEVGDRTAGEPRLARYIDQARAGEGAGQLARAIAENRSTVFSLATAKDSARVIAYRNAAKRTQNRYRTRIAGDGTLKERPHTEAEWKRRYPQSVRRYTELYSDVYTDGLDPDAQSYVERTLRFMNRRGATPVIVLTPINPKLLAEVEPLGWRERHGQVLACLEALQAEYDFVLVDITDPARFGADPIEYHDGVHLTSANTRRAIDHVLERTGGIPR